MSPRAPDPRFATARDPRYDTLGWRPARISAQMGQPFMPWQQLVDDVALEIDDRGLFRYHLVVVTVPRQSGKTTLVLANGVDRALFAPPDRPAKVWHTAQSGQDARTKWLEMAEQMQRSPLAPLVQLKRGAGDSRMIFPHNGSQLRPHPPTIDALHGQQSDLNDIDEGWAFDAAQGANLMQAIVPTQATRPGAQTWITSTMGTADSTWFHDLVDRGRAGAPGICYFEWSISDDVDPMDLGAVAAAHPAYGHTIDMQALERARDTMAATPGAFARAYGNRRTRASERVIPVQAWLDVATTEKIPDDARPVFAAATAMDRSKTAIVAVAESAGRPVVEVVDYRAGSSWAPSRLAELSERHGRAGVIVDAAGPSGPLADALRMIDDLPLLVPTFREVATACQDIADRITEVRPDGTGPRVGFRPDGDMDTAVEVLAKRPAGDSWLWARRASAGDISLFEAATLGVWALVRAPAQPLAPVIIA